MKKVLVTGTFDIIHPGHLYLLKQAKHQGNFLMVVMARDRTVKKIKGYLPYFDETERVTNLKAQGLADRVILGGFADKLQAVVALRPDIICLGYDQKAFTENLQEKLRNRGMEPTIIRAKKLRPDKHKTGLLHENDLVAIKNVDPTILTDVRYATKNNFTKKKLYINNIILTKKSLAQRLKKVQEALRKRGYGLKIWDSYRPLSVQKKLWQILPDERYVGNPTKKPVHTRAAGIDLTLVNKNGHQLTMPTKYDEFSRRAHRDYPGHSTPARKNLLILEKAMTEQGFIPMPTEWWHFSDPNWKKFPALDISI